MGESELFSYLSAFVTIVLAVAMTDMIQSTHRLIRARRKVTWDARPLVFAAIVALAVVSEFFSLWSNFAVTEVSMTRLLWLLATPAVFALLAYSVLPDECPDGGLDLAQFYDEERRIWVLLFTVAMAMDVARTVEESLGMGWPLRNYFQFVGPYAALMLFSLILIYRAHQKFWSWLGLILLAGAMLNPMISWTIKAKTGA